MPFELGLDFGCRKYSENTEACRKKFLVLGSIKYDYMKALSDISGVDIQYHNNDPQAMVKSIRHWFVANAGLRRSPSPQEIWFKSTDFNAEYVLFARSKGYSPSEMYDIPISELIDMIKNYLSDRPFYAN